MVVVAEVWRGRATRTNEAHVEYKELRPQYYSARLRIEERMQMQNGQQREKSLTCRFKWVQQLEDDAHKPDFVRGGGAGVVVGSSFGEAWWL